MRARRIVWRALVIALLAVVVLLGWAMTRGSAALDLGEAPGMLTGRELVTLRGEPTRCRTLLDRAGVRYDAVASRRDGPACGLIDTIRLGGGARAIALAPDEPPITCPVAAAMAMWEWSVVQPAARRLLGAPVVRIEHLGSYNCRRMYGRDDGPWSEHATADALDIAAFQLADGRRVSVLDDWRGNGPAATFLRRVRTGGCDVFATVLSPDYNAAHRDHLHLDQARRGAMGGRVCR